MKIKGLNHRSKESIQAYLMILPMIIGFLLFTFYPLAWVIRWSFFHYNGYSKPVFVGLENFIRAFSRDPKLWMSVANTFIITFTKLLVQIPLALIVAVLVNGKGKVKSFFRTGFFLPSIISIAVMGIIFYILFEPYQGIVNYLLVSLNITEKGIQWFSNKWTAMILIGMASIWANLGINMVLFLTGLQSVPGSLYECASIDGANKFHQFRHITIPMLAPVMQVIFMLAMVNSMKMTDIVLVLTNGQPAGKTEVIMTYIYKYFFTGEESAVPQIGYASSMAVITAIILAILTCCYMIYSKKKTDIY